MYDKDRDLVAFDRIRENVPMSSGENALVDIAHACFNGHAADIHKTLYGLSGNFSMVAFDALKHCYM